MLYSYTKAFVCVDHNKLENSEKEGNTRPAFWEICVQVKKQQLEGYGSTDWFQIGKGLHQGCILSPCLFNLYAEYVMQNTGLDEPKLESRLPGEVSINSYMQMTPPL